MKQVSIGKFIVLLLVTFGIYSIYWLVSTKEQMNQLGTQIPTAWWFVVPFANIWWFWKYSEGVEHVTGKRMTQSTSFILMLFLQAIGFIVIQNTFNQLPKTS